MANVELDSCIIEKLQSEFSVSTDDINQYVRFFNKNIKPQIKTHYLSHLVTSIEDMINEKRKTEMFQDLDKINNKKEDVKELKRYIMTKNIKLFSIVLAPVEITNGRKARVYNMPSAALICYANYLTEQEKRFVIAHELGHIVTSVFFADNNEQESYASLFAFIALLDKNNFYVQECKYYTSKNDVQLFNDFINIIKSKV